MTSGLMNHIAEKAKSFDRVCRDLTKIRPGIRFDYMVHIAGPKAENGPRFEIFGNGSSCGLFRINENLSTVTANALLSAS